VIEIPGKRKEKYHMKTRCKRKKKEVISRATKKRKRKLKFG